MAKGSAGRGTAPISRTCTATSASITLNLKSDEGKKIFFELVAQADVVVENYRPDVKSRLGIDYEACRKVNPRIVLRQHLRLRPGRALCEARRASTRWRRAWAG